MKNSLPLTIQTCALLATLTLLGTRAAPAATVTVLGSGGDSYLNAQASDGAGASNSQNLAPTIPFNTTQTVTGGAAASTITYNLANAALLVDWTLIRTGLTNSYAQSLEVLRFTVAPDFPGGILSYAISGSLAVTDTGDHPGSATLAVDLYDMTTNSDLYQSDQQSKFALNKTFTLGMQQGDSWNYLYGSPTGTLIAGHTYILQPQSNIWAFSGANTGPATASGHFALTFGDTSTIVPLPITAPASLSLLAGCAALTALRRRNFRNAPL